ncbi:MAG: 16S rRNA (uracil(1498)-N(3))-methyltransferase [Pseudomonadota bacterium]
MVNASLPAPSDAPMSEPHGAGRAPVRVHLDMDLAAGAAIQAPAEIAHYLRNVMRLRQGDAVLAFNSRDGEWRAEISGMAKRAVTLSLQAQTRPPSPPPDLWLLFAPIKKARTDFIVEKACELGCRRVLPVITERTQTARVRADRLRAHAIEAAEQCGTVFVPEVVEAAPLRAVLEGWPPDRALHFCDETRQARPMIEQAAPPPAAILIGPVGGFSLDEARALRAAPFVRPVALGPRILRADTAAAAAIALWQAAQGDWSAAAPEACLDSGEAPA